MFGVGDVVVHPMHGGGVIDAIVRENNGGMTQEYYVFKMMVGGLLLKIPTANSDMIGLRAVSRKEDVEELLEAIPSMQVEDNTNWNKRYRENMVRVKSGDLYQLAGVIKSLTLRDRERGLSTGERKMLHSAKQIMLSEFVLTGEGDYDQMEQRLDQAMGARA